MRIPAELYADSMGLICQRFHLLEALQLNAPAMTHTETVALQVQKIIEGIAFSALSGTEHRNKETLIGLRSKDGSEIIRTLSKRRMLHLPASQDIELSYDTEYRAVLSGRGDRDLTVDELIVAFSLASKVIHERHPERLTQEGIVHDRDSLRLIARRLRDWLWTHMVSHKGQAIVVQMALYPQDGWCGTAANIAPLPDHVP